MRMLVIRAQDITAIEVAYVIDGSMVKHANASAQPEAYLQEVDRLMHEWGIGLEGLDAIGVVAGPGSFTASRVSVTIANAIAFVRSIPIYTTENPKHLPLPELLATIVWETPKPDQFAQPVYDRPPHITQPTNNMDGRVLSKGSRADVP